MHVCMWFFVWPLFCSVWPVRFVWLSLSDGARSGPCTDDKTKHTIRTCVTVRGARICCVWFVLTISNSICFFRLPLLLLVLLLLAGGGCCCRRHRRCYCCCCCRAALLSFVVSFISILCTIGSVFVLLFLFACTYLTTMGIYANVCVHVCVSPVARSPLAMGASEYNIWITFIYTNMYDFFSRRCVISFILFSFLFLMCCWLAGWLLTVRMVCARVTRHSFGSAVPFGCYTRNVRVSFVHF